MLRSFFRGWPPATRQPHAVDWSVGQGIRQLDSSATNGLLVNASDLYEQAVSTPTNPLRFHRQIPTPLLLIQPTQQHIHLLAVVLTVGVRLTPPARGRIHTREPPP